MLYCCRRNLVHHRPKVIEELREKVTEMGFSGDLLDRIVQDIQSDDERLIKFLYRTCHFQCATTSWFSLLSFCLARDTDKFKCIVCIFAAAEEDDEDHRNPLIAMGISACLFIGGSLPSVLPFLFVHNGDGKLQEPGVLSATIAAGLHGIF